MLACQFLFFARVAADGDDGNEIPLGIRRRFASLVLLRVIPTHLFLSQPVINQHISTFLVCFHIYTSMFAHIDPPIWHL